MKKALLALIALTLLFTAAASASLGRMSEFEIWLDGFMDAQLKDHNIAGATIAVVKGGRLFFYNGYGYADVDSKTPVKAASTLFRAGSISKLITWTAVMQLVEQGKLDLNTDVNYYLKNFKVPNTFPKPITLAHLMTHTAGFEDRTTGLVVGSYDTQDSLEEYLIKNMPKRIWPAGKRAVYSNYGAALAGYIVQEISGILFEDYVKENILEPLEMAETTFSQQQTTEFKRALAQGYVFSQGKFMPKGFEFINAEPAGSVSTTSLDMTKFMIAMVNNGKIKRRTYLLKPETVELMQKQHYTYDPALPGMCYGFYELDQDRYRTIGHSGSTSHFGSLLFLIPDEKVGVFISYNGPNGKTARQEFYRAFMDRYYSGRQPPACPERSRGAASDQPTKIKQFAGQYLSNRRAYTTLEKVLQLVNPVDQVKSMADGTLLFQGKRLTPIGQNIFRELYGKQKYVFNTLDGRLFLEFAPVLAYEKLAWFENISFHWLILWACVLAFLSAVLIWPVLLVIDKSHHVKVEGSTAAVWLSIIASGLNLIFLPLIYKNLQEAVSDPHILDWILVIPIAAGVLAIGSLIYTIMAWKNKYWSLIIRLHYTLVTLALMVFIWWLNYWNLFGFKY